MKRMVVARALGSLGRGGTARAGLLIALALLGSSPAWVHAGEGWRTLLYLNDIRGIAAGPDTVFLATTGGAVAYSRSDGGWREWHRSDGSLGSDTLTCVAALSDGRVAFGTVSSGVSVYDGSSGIWITYNPLVWPLATSAVRSIWDDGSRLIVGSDGGFMIADASSLDLLAGCSKAVDICGLTGWTVVDVARLEEDYFFASEPNETETGGVARLRLGAGSVWDTLNSGLPTRYVEALEVRAETLWCAVGYHAAVFDGASWDTRDEGLPCRHFVCDLVASPSGSLFAAVSGDSGGVFVWDDDLQSWRRVGQSTFPAYRVAVGPDGSLWAGASARRSGSKWLDASLDGLWEYAGGKWLHHHFESPHPLRYFRGLWPTKDGCLWASVSGSWGLQFFNGSHWLFFNDGNSHLTNDWVFALVPGEESVWVGHCCCSCESGRCPLDLWVPTYTQPDTGAVDTLGIHNVWDYAYDTSGRIWLATWHETEEESAYGVYCVDPSTREILLHLDRDDASMPLRSNQVRSIACCGGYLWIGYENHGLSRCRLGIPPEVLSGAWEDFNASEDPWLPSNRVTCMEPAGEALFVGTGGGLIRWCSEGGRDSWDGSFVPALQGAGIVDICVAGDGSVWVGLDGSRGVVRLRTEGNAYCQASSVDDYELAFFTAPDLVCNDVTSLAPGPSRGQVWVGTQRGLSLFTPNEAPQWEPVEARKGLDVYPNPFDPDCDGAVRFKEPPSWVRDGIVVDAAGLPVRRLKGIRAGEVLWDGRDEKGRRVPPGLYVIRVHSAYGTLTARVGLVDRDCSEW